MRARFTVGLLAIVLTFCASAFAHHGNAAFAMDQSVTLHGTVTDFLWANPHVVIYFDAKNDKGETLHWSCEASAPPKLHREGWTRESLKPGDQIIVVAHPSKNGSPVGFLQKVSLVNGPELKLGAE
jgi:hypothetical protein